MAASIRHRSRPVLIPAGGRPYSARPAEIGQWANQAGAKTESGPAALRAVHTGAGGPGVLGVSQANGVIGRSTGDGLGSAGVFGEAITGPGVSGSSTSSVGVDAKTQSGPAALRAVHAGGGVAGLFGGDVHVTHDLRVDSDPLILGTLSVAKDVVLTGGDCAEHFDLVPDALCEPGTAIRPELLAPWLVRRLVI
jgi:hypothetical protein